MTCGVAAAKRSWRGTVSTTTPPFTRLIVSVTGLPARAAPCSAAAATTAATSAGSTSGRAAS